MKVKIIKASKNTYWWANHIGKTFNVEATEGNNFFGYCVTKGRQLGNYIEVDDTEIIKSRKE